MDELTTPTLQAKIFDFALSELVCQHRDSFQPLWTVDSWVKFLIWLALNCGLSGERESLQFFADALGDGLTSRMRRLFFERVLDDLGLKFIADPADSEILLMPLNSSVSISYEEAMEGLETVGLIGRANCERDSWQFLNAVIAIPWEASDQSC